MGGCSHQVTILRNWIATNQVTTEELAKIRSLVCQYAANLTGHNYWVSREYHDVIYAFGDEAWRDYFQQGFGYRQTRYQFIERRSSLVASSCGVL